MGFIGLKWVRMSWIGFEWVALSSYRVLFACYWVSFHSGGFEWVEPADDRFHWVKTGLPWVEVGETGLG